jgi:hypothetical protein
MTASGVAFGTPSAPNAYVGQITALQGSQIAASLQNASGRRIAVQVSLRLDESTRRVTGTIQGSSQ